MLQEVHRAGLVAGFADVMPVIQQVSERLQLKVTQETLRTALTDLNIKFPPLSTNKPRESRWFLCSPPLSTPVSSAKNRTIHVYLI